MNHLSNFLPQMSGDGVLPLEGDAFFSSSKLLITTMC
jgi:hypothetical protein